MSTRKPMNTAQRLAHSARMKMIWAKRRANGTATRRPNGSGKRFVAPGSTRVRITPEQIAANLRARPVSQPPTHPALPVFETRTGQTNGQGQQFILVLPETHGYEFAHGSARLLIPRDDLKTLVATLVAAL